jgi:peptide methionine sulfoxide reductase msrA/msrB
MNNKTWLRYILSGIIIITSIGLFSACKKTDTESMKGDENMTKKETTKKENSRFPENPNLQVNYENKELKEIWLAGGCFWGVEAYMARVYGVADAVSGYANGNTENPSYEDVLYRKTGHAETVYVKYDPEIISLENLLKAFFNTMNPTTVNRQGNDIGSQYRSGIYYKNPEDLGIIKKALADEQKNYSDKIATEVLPLSNFTIAEEYHQDYLDKNPNGYCHVEFDTLDEINEIKVDPALYSVPDKEELKKKLTPLQYAVAIENDTELAFSNEYWDNKEKGLYVDIVTGEPLFLSTDKYESGCGWPSFTKPVVPEVVTYIEDKSYGMVRTEVRSRVGNIHLGHVFNDGPKESGGLRFCINSASIRFIPIDEMAGENYGQYIGLIE